ncbi:hypothetical protein D8I30_04210 [Brevundimonas naejangsanensis]|uniref:Uncharacterized protein n=1 Tax=Brevundimonas naejangsanensis TaxID=588932 RepID=A0A494RHA5_9CAUL|nr:hypothetical protein [Brevundimonas naejangsanensis]AYG94473.1 hypothetical protein D8I30_04210 [Brevundimonas naejangsanensis]
MTRDQVQSVHDDIAYMKALAQEGRRAPLLGGRILVAAGLVFGLAALVHYAAAAGVVMIGGWGFVVLWGVAMAVFFAALMVCIRKDKTKPGAHSLVNRAGGAGWMGVGLATFVLFLSMVVIAWTTRRGDVFLIFPSLIFALYGAGWAVSATMSGQRWQWRLAVGSWIAAPLIAFLTGSPLMWLGYAAGLVLFALVPGLVLVRQEPAEVI